VLLPVLEFHPIYGVCCILPCKAPNCVQVASCASKYDNQMSVKHISTFLSEEQLSTHCTMPDLKRTQ